MSYYVKKRGFRNTTASYITRILYYQKLDLRIANSIETLGLSVGVKSGRNWHARTPKVTPLNSLFFALCLPKIYNPCRSTFEEATDSESKKISSDLYIICWRKRGFIVFARHANIGHFFLRLSLAW